MKKITFDSMPEAISELIIKISKLEKLLSGKESGLKKKKTQKGKTTKRATKAGKKAQAKKPARINKDLLNLQQASRLLKISSSNLYAYVKGKKIPFKKDGRRLYFSKPELEKWNKKRGVVNAKAKGKTGDAITVTEAAKLLNISAVTLYYHIKKQRIPVISKSGKSMFYSKKALFDVVGSKLRKKQSQSKPKPPAKSAKPVKSAKLSGQIKQGEQTKSAKKTTPAKKSKPARAKKAEQIEQTKESKPSKLTKSAKGAKPAKKVKKLKPAKKVAMVKQAKPKVKALKKPRQQKQPVQAPVENEQSKPVELPEPPSPSQDQNNIDS